MTNFNTCRKAWAGKLLYPLCLLFLHANSFCLDLRHGVIAPHDSDGLDQGAFERYRSMQALYAHLPCTIHLL